MAEQGLGGIAQTIGGCGEASSAMSLKETVHRKIFNSKKKKIIKNVHVLRLGKREMAIHQNCPQLRGSPDVALNVTDQDIVFHVGHHIHKVTPSPEGNREIANLMSS